jgi:hypothetical protein
MNAHTPTTALRRERWEALVESHRAVFAEVIAIAEAHPYRASDPVAIRAACSTISQLAEQARRLSIALDREAADPQFASRPHGFGSLGTWGDNGHGPRIAKLLSSARFHAERLAEAATRRAA